MFGKLREKLKDALTVFSKKTEEEAEVKQVEVEVSSEPIESIAPEYIEDSSSSVSPVHEEIAEKDVVLPVVEKEKIAEVVQVDNTKAEVKVSPETEKKGFFSKIFNSKTAEQPASAEKKSDEVQGIAAVQKNVAVDQKVVSEDKVVSKEDIAEPTKLLVEKKVDAEKKVGAEKKVVESKKIDVKPVQVKHEVNVVKEEQKQQITKQETVIKSDKKVVEDIVEPKGFFGKLKQAITTKTISEEKFMELFWDLELALLENNVSVEVIEKIKLDLIDELVDKPLPRDVEGKIMETLKGTLSSILTMDTVSLLDRIRLHAAEKTGKPFVIAFFGINGAGKTTSIAKLAYYLQKNGKSVVLAACDTFRAAAIQQLEEHAVKLNCKIIKHDYGSDAAAVAFDAIKYAEKSGVDVVLIDTAGRLHSNTNLMAELEKIIRTTKPHLKIFVGESITGNDCIEQATQFNKLVQMDGAILTKADVDEKGGAPISIAYVIKKPILFLGVGQTYDDFEPFDREKILAHLGL